MTVSASRLTMYAILSALEEDLRAVGSVYLSDLEPRLALADAFDSAASRLMRQHGVVIGDPTISDLLPFIDFDDARKGLLRNSDSLPVQIVQHLKSVSQQLEKLAPIRNRVAHGRPLDFDDFSFTFDLARELSGVNEFPWSTLREVTDRLATDPGFVLSLDVKFDSSASDSDRHNLPIPEYDETGFVGRRDVAATLRRLLLKGAYPVVSVVGDGGLGKTSLALKVAYDVLDTYPSPFDAVVWVTAKTTLLTPTEITRIEGAISDSLGMLTAAARNLGGESATIDPIAEVLTYMEEFKILLILDNLETVLDQTLRDFLANLPVGSKVLITSRIGVGAYEHPVRLEPLSQVEGVSLFRALVRIKNVAVLKRLKDEDVVKLVGVMGGRPLFIRWFVSAVEAGARPEDILANNEVLLDFCMSNVFVYLSPDSQAVLRSMQVLPAMHGQAELAYLNDMPIDTLKPALLQLANTYFVDMQASGSSGSVQTSYGLTDFARIYLDRQQHVGSDERDWLINRHEELTRSGMQVQAQHQMSPYSRKTLDTRGTGDVSVSRTLVNAISLIARNLTEEASDLIAASKELAPGYFEVHRVEGDLRAAERNFLGARAAYETAIELEPNSARLRYFFGRFLCSQGGDIPSGLRQLQEGARLIPSEPILSLAVARAHLQLGNCEEARDIGLAMIGWGQLSPDMRRKIAATTIEACVIQAQRAADRGDWPSCVAALEEFTGLLGEVSTSPLEPSVRARLDQARTLANISQRRSADAYVAKVAVEVMSVLATVTMDSLLDYEGRTFGRVARLVTDRGFGFIKETGSDVEYFFHVRDLSRRADWEQCNENISVSFVPSTNAQGPRAVKVLILGF